MSPGCAHLGGISVVDGVGGAELAAGRAIRGNNLGQDLGRRERSTCVLHFFVHLTLTYQVTLEAVHVVVRGSVHEEPGERGVRVDVDHGAELERRRLVYGDQQLSHGVDRGMGEWAGLGPDAIEVLSKEVPARVAQKHPVRIQHGHHL